MATLSLNHSQHNPQGAPIYCNGKPVGRVERGIFHKTITGSKHLLRTPRAIAFDVSTLQDAAAAGAISARVVDRETGTVYTATLERIHAKGAPLTRGYGQQWYLPLDQWAINGARPAADAKAAESNKEIAELQLSLFGGAE